MTIETKKLVISEELKRKIEMICKFAYVEYSFTNGYIINLKNTNLAYVEPHRVIIKEKLFLFFNNHEYFYIGNLENKYPIARLQDMVN